MNEEVKTKTELLSEMRELQSAYSKVASKLKVITAKEEQEQLEARQLERLASYKTKYNFYIQDDGTTKAIDWEEVEKLLKTSFTSQNEYGLGFDQTGMEGLGSALGSGSGFTPMVETERDAVQYIEREKRRQDFIVKNKQR